ncbi:hypothetical protein [Halomonas shantousis]
MMIPALVGEGVVDALRVSPHGDVVVSRRLEEGLTIHAVHLPVVVESADIAGVPGDATRK